MNLDQIPWKYRAEGNANLVLALPDTRQVLRLKKVDVVAPGDLRGDANENFQYLKTVVDYIKEISSLLLDDFVIDPQLVILLLKDIDLFNKQLSQYRPGEDDKWDDQGHIITNPLYPSSGPPIKGDSIPFRNNVSRCDISARLSDRNQCKNCD